jgi:hypothetical protein
MIGFKIEATSDKGFSYSLSRWTEGSLWLAKQSLSKSQNKVAGWSANQALIDAIEGQFAKIKSLKLDAAVMDTPKYELCVMQDFHFTYTLNPAKSLDLLRYELARKIAACSNDMGDQVALGLFECMIQYKTHFVSTNKFNAPYNFLNVWISL